MNRRIRGLAAGAAVLCAGATLAIPSTALAGPDETDAPSSTTTAPSDTTTDAGNDAEADTATRGRTWATSWLREVLTPLVESGTLSEAQLDAVLQALTAARPELPARPWPHQRWHGPWRLAGARALTTAADAIGIGVRELRDALADGQTLAEIAEANGVSPDTVIDALVEAATERLEAAVADGRLDEDDADEWRAELEEDVRELVEEGGWPWRLRHRELPRLGPWHHHRHDDPDDTGRDDRDRGTERGEEPAPGATGRGAED
jgi:hypothetical protein